MKLRLLTEPFPQGRTSRGGSHRSLYYDGPQTPGQPLCRPRGISEGLTAFPSAQSLPHGTSGVLITIQTFKRMYIILFLLEKIRGQHLEKLVTAVRSHTHLLLFD